VKRPKRRRIIRGHREIREDEMWCFNDVTGIEILFFSRGNFKYFLGGRRRNRGEGSELGWRRKGGREGEERCGYK
jgi:hypothetical protein